MKKRRGAFTFVEILAALTFLAILIPAVTTAVTISNRAAVAAERSRLAVQLADRQLSEMIVASAWQTAGNGGDFGPDYAGYRWQLTQETWPGDINNPMTQMTVTVFYRVQGQDREVHLDTLVNSSLTQ